MFLERKKLPTGTDNKIFRHTRVVMNKRRSSSFRVASRLRIRMYRYRLRESQCRHRTDTCKKKHIRKIKHNGIGIGEVPVLRFVYKHRCRCMRIRRRDVIRKEKQLPTGTDNKLFRHMRVVMHERRSSSFRVTFRLRIRMYRYKLHESQCRY
jgi:tRNA U38,U39,U40 pseudouridine synthase TruA